MSKALNYMANQNGPGRRSNRDYEMRPLMSSSSTTLPPSSTYDKSSSSSDTKSSTVSKIMDRLKQSSSWDDKFRFSQAHHRREKKRIRSRFAVNVPTRLIVHLIIVFFLIPLTLGTFFLIRALFFGLKEDEDHPLHKKIPKSRLKTKTPKQTEINSGIGRESHNVDSSVYDSLNITSGGLNTSLPQVGPTLLYGEDAITNTSLASPLFEQSNSSIIDNTTHLL